MAWREGSPATSQAFISPALVGLPKLPQGVLLMWTCYKVWTTLEEGRRHRRYPVQKVASKYPLLSYLPQHRGGLLPSALIAVQSQAHRHVKDLGPSR